MSDYTQVNDYSAKDALATGNPLKLIKGSDVDAEFAAISTAIASKFDSTDIATAAEAQAGVSNTVVITPARLTAWGQNDAGVIEDLQALADPDADRILFWDDSAGAATFLTVGTGLAITDTTIAVDETGFARQVIAGEGLSGGGALSSDVTLDLDINELTALTAIAAADELVFADADDSNISKKITLANLEASIDAANLSGGVSTATVLTAGSGLSYSVGGTNIGTTSTIDLDIDELTLETTLDSTADYVAFYDGSAAANRKVNIDALVGAELGDGRWYRSTDVSLTADTPTTVVYNTEAYDSLTRGTFSTSTGVYTVGSAGARILISAGCRVTADENEECRVRIQVNGTTIAESGDVLSAGTGAASVYPFVTAALNLSASDTVRVQVETGGGASTAAGPLEGGQANTYVSIVELG